MSLTAHVWSADHLPEFADMARQLFGHRYDDPFCELTFHQQTQATKPKFNQPNPEWKQKFEWTLEVVPKDTEEIEVPIIDFEKSENHRVMCKGSIPIDTVLTKGNDRREVLLTVVGGTPRKEKPKLQVTLSYRAPKSEALQSEVNRLKAALANAKKKLKEKLEGLGDMIDGIEEELDAPPAKRGRYD